MIYLSKGEFISMTSILVVEDHDLERKNLIQMLQALEDVQIVEASSGKKALHLLQQHPIDLFLLDIQLPDLSGFTLAKQIRLIPEYEFSYMIFITTHIYYQLDAFKSFHCYDFIEKPYKKEELLTLIKKLLRGIRQTTPLQKQCLTFELPDYVLKVPIDDIFFIESRLKNCILHTKNWSEQIPNITMKKMLTLLPNHFFMQTHRSYIVNLKNISQIEKKSRQPWTIHFPNFPLQAYVSNTYKKKLLEKTLL